MEKIISDSVRFTFRIFLYSIRILITKISIISHNIFVNEYPTINFIFDEITSKIFLLYYMIFILQFSSQIVFYY